MVKGKADAQQKSRTLLGDAPQDDVQRKRHNISNDEIEWLIRLRTDLSVDRAPWMAFWPSLAQHFDATGYRDGSQGDTNITNIVNSDIVDTTGIIAARTLASGLQGGVTSPARPWFSLTLQGGETPTGDMAAFIDETAKRMRFIFHKSNFYNVCYQLYFQLATFGTGCVFEEADTRGVWFTCIPVGTYVFDVSARGDVNIVIRNFWLTPSQILDEFGRESLPMRFKHLDDKKIRESREKLEVFHAVYPRDVKKVKASLHGTTKPFASVYYLGERQNGLDYCVLRESGFDDMPCFCVRWDVQAGDVYGKSPAMDVLGDCMQLQVVVEDMSEGIHKQVNPPVNAPASLEATGVDLTPGGVNYYDFGLGAAGVTPTFQSGIDVGSANLLKESLKHSIQTGMYNDLFRMLMSSDRRQITATEIASKEEEKLVLIGPVLERLHDEFLSPLIERTFNIMAKFNFLPLELLPDGGNGENLSVEFTSTLAQAQKMVATSGIEQALAFITNVAQAKPEVLDMVNGDEFIRVYCNNLGVESSLLLGKDEVQAKRQARAQQEAQAQQQAQMQQEMAGMTQMAQQLGNTPMGNDQNPTALDAVLGGAGGL